MIPTKSDHSMDHLVKETGPLNVEETLELVLCHGRTNKEEDPRRVLINTLAVGPKKINV